MILRRFVSVLVIIIFTFSASVIYGVNSDIKPVTPNASQEVKSLLKLLHNISGKFTLTGQHNFPNSKDRNTQFAAEYIGKTPAVYSQDWGFAADGDKDSYLARPEIVEEVIKQHKRGSIITICWHAVPPTADEPVTFQPLNDSIDGNSLKSVLGNLTDKQFIDLLTPGTEIYKKWENQVDEIAVYLKKLEEAKVPILWRPYHEMNGDWFWWGGRTGQYGTKELYIQLYNRLVNRHKLNNLIWVWSVDRPNKEGMEFSKYYPGDKYVDILSLDVYENDFGQNYYDSLSALSNGKLLALGEVANPPSSEILENQPNWSYYVTWAGMVRNTLKKTYNELLNDTRILNLDDPVYWGVMVQYREICGLQQLPVEQKKDNFNGIWIFNEEKSTLNGMGPGNLPYKLIIEQNNNEIVAEKLMLVEYDDDKLIEEKFYLDGSESKSEFMNSPKTTTANLSAAGDTLIIKSKVTFNPGDGNSEMTVKETWTIHNNGKSLSIQQSSNSSWDQREITMIFDLKRFNF